MSERHQQVEAAILARRERVNEALPEELPITRPEGLYEATRYLLDAGGKRLRPTVLLLVAESLADVEPLSTDYREFPTLDGGRADVLSAAIAIEVIQTFTLIHDDIMDDDDLRRGVPAVHKEYDLSTAILAGDTLYSKAFEFLLETGAKAERTVAANKRLARTCTRICEGQSLDIEFEQRDAVTPDEYLEMVELKTAVLYGAAASIPATLSGADEATVEALYNHGLDVGRAFQIQDDLLDLTTPSEKLGKQRGSDLVENKQTLVTLHASRGPRHWSSRRTRPTRLPTPSASRSAPPQSRFATGSGVSKSTRRRVSTATDRCSRRWPRSSTTPASTSRRRRSSTCSPRE